MFLGFIHRRVHRKISGIFSNRCSRTNGAVEQTLFGKSERELRPLCSQLLTVEGKEAREADEASETLERMERHGQPDSKKQRDLLELVEDAGYKRANAPL
jgi:hypothetical protein